MLKQLWRWLLAARHEDYCQARFYPAVWRSPTAVDRHYCERWAHHPGWHKSSRDGVPFRWI